MLDWFVHIITYHPYIVYAIIVFVSFVEGPILSMICGLLLRIGYLDFPLTYASLMLGDLIGDVFWYYLGYFVGHKFIKRFGKYFSITEEGVQTVSTIFHTYKDYILIISKITMGFGFALVTLVTAGIVRIPFKRYITLNAMGQFVWTGLLMIVGYFLGQAYTTFDNIFSKTFIAAIFILVIVALFGYGKYVRSHMMTKLNQ